MNRRLGSTRARVFAGVLAIGFGAAFAPAMAQTPLTATRLSNGAPMSFADLIERVSPAVVSINVTTEVAGPTGGEDFNFEGLPEGFDEFFREFRRQFEESGPQEGRSLGSGFFISADGYLVTNHHVVDDAKSIMVRLKEGEEYDAEIIGQDPSTDLAVLKVQRDAPFAYVEFSDTLDLRVGDWVVAVGNPFGLESTATAGIVSALGREVNSTYTSFIQIDAPINRGNSGGPAFDLQGRVVGVNSQIFSPSGGSVGIGFAIPSTTASRIVEKLISDGRVARGWLGVYIQTVTDELAEGLGLEDGEGAIVSSVIDDSPAQKAGLEPQDVIIAIDDKKVESAIDLTRRVGDLIAGDTVKFKVVRDGRERTVRVKIAERPDDGDGSTPALPSAAQPDDELVFGMSLRRLTEEDRERLEMPSGETGVVVDSVRRSSTAFERGVRDGVVILEAGGEKVTSSQDLRDAMSNAKTKGRSALLLLIQTGGGRTFVALPLDADE